MISDMQKMGKAFLANPGTDDLEGGLTSEQRKLEFLCERHETGTPVYVLYPGEPGVAYLRRQELQSGQSWRLPFIKLAPNSAYIVPVFKVEGKLGGKESKRNTTRKHFQRLSKSALPASPYFDAIVQVLEAKEFISVGQNRESISIPNAYEAAIKTIISRPVTSGKASLLVVATDPHGDVWPGDDPQLVDWFLTTPERLTMIYGQPAETNHPSARCALCDVGGPLYSNALAGAGLNFVNGDFQGSFPDMRVDKAWQRFAICACCADLLYVYKNHVANDFQESIVGATALIVPSADIDDIKGFNGFLKNVRLMQHGSNRAAGERTVLRRIAGDATVATLSILWAEKYGQKIEGIRSFVTNVMPTRLAELEKEVNTFYNRRQNHFDPRDLRVRREIDLNLKIAFELLPFPKHKDYEKTLPRRRALLYELAASVFHGVRMKPGPLWKEIALVAEEYWSRLLGEKNSKILYQCGQEAPKDNLGKKWQPLTVNGWVRHMHLFLDYLSDERVNVLPKEIAMYEATQETLKPLLLEAKGLDTDAKRFTFLLGILYGHLIWVQAKKAEVNVAANALSWMRSGRLRAAELHELFGKVSAKLLEYDALEVGRYHKWKEIHELETELGQLGKRVPIPIRPEDLPDDQVLFFLMLGIALSYDFTTSGLPTKQGESK